ncbi:MAG: toast rack family protein [Anaerolineales bacterium]
MKQTTKVVILSLLLAITLSGCGINIELPFKTESKTGETVTESIQVPIPNLNPPLDVNLSFGAGKMTLLPNPGPDLLSGTVTYNVADFKPELTVDDTGVTFKQGNLKINAVPTFNGSIKNEWNIAITNHPIELSIKAGAYSGDFEFGGLALTDLHVTDGASNVNLKFSTPNTSLMNAFRYETGASNITMEKLGNANFQTMIFQSGAGNYSLDFSGVYQHDASVFIETGLSRLIISVPEGIQAEVNLEGPLSKVITSGNWQESGDEYILEGQGPKLIFTIETKAGTVTLKNP